MALFVIYSDFKSILEPLGRQVMQITYFQQHKVWAAAAICCSSFCRYNQLTVMKVKKNALTEFLNVLIEWETAIVEELRTNQPMKHISAKKQTSIETRRNAINVATRLKKPIQSGSR